MYLSINIYTPNFLFFIHTYIKYIKYLNKIYTKTSQPTFK